MTRFGLIILSALFAALELNAQDLTSAAQIVDVWPGKAPGDAGQVGEEKWQGSKATSVTKPTLAVYPADKDKNTGTAIIVAPGGGYRELMMEYEGANAAKWLNPLGVTVFVLKYRVPAPAGVPKHAPALQDAQRTISLIRSRAKEWKINPARIGMMGFSAGGHLSAASSTNFESRTYDAIDDVDKISCRPDFAIVIYPGAMLDKDKPDGTLSDSIHVSAQTPPSFIAMSHDDRVNSENAVYYYLALKKAGVQAELHIFATGGHGWGMQAGDKPFHKWVDRCTEWLTVQGLLKPTNEAQLPAGG